MNQQQNNQYESQGVGRNESQNANPNMNQNNNFIPNMNQGPGYDQAYPNQGIAPQNRILNVYPPEYGNEESGFGGEPQAPTTGILSKAAFALFIMGVAVLLSQQLISMAVGSFWPWVAETNWYLWVLTAFSMICVGLPVAYLLTRRLPEPKRGEIVKLKPMQFMVFFIISTSVMYITNFFSVFLSFIIAYLKGGSFLDLNPLMEMMEGSNMIIRIMYAAIAAPIVEELIFRKLILNKLRRYGDIPAILISGIAFGLFHMNVAQMFYATALGIIFAYVAVRTNTIRYSILLHILINSLGAVIAPLAMKQSIVFNFLIVGWMFTSIIIGILLFALNVKKIKLFRVQKPLEKKSGYLLNIGTILYTALCLVIIVLQIIAS